MLIQAMETANRVAFYLSISVGIPIIILSYRCVFTLCKPEHWKNAFCKIFVAILIANSLVYTLLMFNLRISGMGWFTGFYAAIAKEPWLPFFSFTIRIFFQLSMMLSFALSLNRVTSLYLTVESNEKIWRHFMYLHLPLMFVTCGLLGLETAMNRAEFTAQKNSANETYYQFTNYNLTINIDTYWMTLETVFDAVANVAILLKFVQIRMNQVKRTVSETSLYLVSFCNFILHVGTAAVQLSLRYGWIPNSAKPLVFLFSNAFLDATVLMPTIFILALTKEIRNAVKRTIMKVATCMCQPAAEYTSTSNTTTIV